MDGLLRRPAAGLGYLLPVDFQEKPDGLLDIGSAEWAMPQAVTDMVDALNFYSDPATGAGILGPNRDPVLKENARHMLELPVPGAVASMVGKGAPKGAVTMFGGVNAKTADKNALKMAQELDSVGADRREIWDATGWFKGADDKWRFEIDDNGAHRRTIDELESIGRGFDEKKTNKMDVVRASLAEEKIQPDLFPKERIKDRQRLRNEAKAFELEKNSTYGPMQSSYIGRRAEYDIHHPGLNENYPELMRETVVRDQGFHNNILGSYSADKDQLGLYSNAKPSTPFHELQHAIQRSEGFARGGSPDGLARVIKDEADAEIGRLNERLRNIVKAKREAEAAGDVNKVISADVEYGKVLREREDLVETAGADPYSIYRRLAGESEARNVESRMDFTPEQRRATPPWETLDVPEDELIVRFNANPAMAGILGMYMQQGEQ